MDRSIFTKAILLVGLAGGVVACSHAQAVCELICECEHCNDQDEVLACDQYATSQDVADAYDCGDSYDTYLSCVEDKGKCDDTSADYSTRSDGSCSGTQSLGSTCMTANDCQNPGGGGDVVCTNGMCQLTVCTGSNNPCQNNGDCQGEDLCTDARDAYQKCIDAASDHEGVAGGL